MTGPWIDPARVDLYQYYVGWLMLLSAVLYVFRQAYAKQLTDDETKTASVTIHFKNFQKTYLVVFIIMMAADWLQGPYVYSLYKHYGYSQQEIGILFIAGFGSSLVFGTIVGSLADKYGRKRLCLTFAALYSISCLTKHSSQYEVLMLGRILGGISTSILFSAFESWMVQEHHEAAYPEEWLGITFSLATAGNGIVAIVCGVVASISRDNFGPVAPFDVSLLCLLLGGLIVAMKWGENYGDSNINLLATIRNAYDRLVEDRKIIYLGVIQSFFEGAMYIFVFMWTPALESTSDREIFHGWIFASFMICVLIGSTLFNVLLKMGMKVERFAVHIFQVAAGALLIPAFIQVHTVRMFCFCVFEICCGMFWPSLGLMRSRYVPEEVRATVMNFFRVPLNCIVVIVLARIGQLSEFQVFLLCTGCLTPAIICQVLLMRVTVDNPDIGAKRHTERELDDIAVPLHDDRHGHGGEPPK
jgi:MFS family permease